MSNCKEESVTTMNDDDKDLSTVTKQQLKNRKKREAKKKKKLEQKQIQEENTDGGSHQVGSDTTQQAECVVDNFEEELFWCIQQLETGMRMQKPSADQIDKTKKLTTQLRSKKTPKPKKRMLMKNHFGNYRDKMAKERTAQKGAVSKLVEVSDETMKKSVFVKKKANDMPSATISQPNNMFRFNFPDPT